MFRVKNKDKTTKINFKWVFTESSGHYCVEIDLINFSSLLVVVQEFSYTSLSFSLNGPVQVCRSCLGLSVSSFHNEPFS